MPTRIYLGNGRSGATYPQEQASGSLLDRGVLYGDAVFESLRTFGGSPFRLAAHLDRIEAAAALTGIAYPGAAYLGDAVRQVLAAAGEPEASLRITLTRALPYDWGPLGGGTAAGPAVGGGGADPSSATSCRVTVVANPLQLPMPALYRDGCDLTTVNVGAGGLCSIPGIKSTSYLASIVALGLARRRGSHEALAVDPRGSLLEGATSNLFVVSEGRLHTPGPVATVIPGSLAPCADAIPIRGGVTREVVLELGRALGLDVFERQLTLDELFSADEAFVTSSIRGILPVARVDGAAIGKSDSQGVAIERSVTGRLMAAYESLARRESQVPPF